MFAHYGYEIASKFASRPSRLTYHHKKAEVPAASGSNMSCSGGSPGDPFVRAHCFRGAARFSFIQVLVIERCLLRHCILERILVQHLRY